MPGRRRIARSRIFRNVYVDLKLEEVRSREVETGQDVEFEYMRFRSGQGIHRDP